MGDKRYWLYADDSTSSLLAISEAVLEVSSLSRAFDAVEDSPLPHQTLFPNVARLIVGAVFGSQDEVWATVAEQQLTGTGGASATDDPRGKADFIRNTITASQMSILAIFSKSPITHFCQRGYAGPLSLPKTFHWRDPFSRTGKPPPPTDPPFTFHYSAITTETRVPAVIGLPNYWLPDLLLPAGEFTTLTDVIDESLTIVRDGRDKIWRNPHARLDKRLKPTLDIAIYGHTAGLPSSTASCHLHDKKKVIKTTNARLRAERSAAKAFRRGEADNIIWRPASDGPLCQACGSVCEK